MIDNIWIRFDEKILRLTVFKKLAELRIISAVIKDLEIYI